MVRCGEEEGAGCAGGEGGGGALLGGKILGAK